MAGYIMIDLEITDPEGFKEYLKLAGPTLKQYGGKVLIGGATPENLEGATLCAVALLYTP
jgi:uncharacterized protein (DUF1330 family)